VSSNAFYFALFVAPTNQTTVDNTLAGWTFTGNYATNTFAGRLSGDYDVSPPDRNFGVIIPGYPAGSSANLVVVGWSANVGHDWSLVGPLVRDGSISERGFFAISDISVGFYLTGGLQPIDPIFGQILPWQIPGFTLNAPIPEPAPWPLVLAGGAAAWLFRRRPGGTRRGGLVQ
jgi:hypothetical protein